MWVRTYTFMHACVDVYACMCACMHVCKYILCMHVLCIRVCVYVYGLPSYHIFTWFIGCRYETCR
jgi:hypothetical protein